MSGRCCEDMLTKNFLAGMSISFYPEIIVLAEQHWVCPL